MRVVGRKLLVHPTQIENTLDLSDQVIWWHHLVEVKRIKELALSAFPPPHHRPLPQITAQSTKSRVIDSLNQCFATQSAA